MLFKNVYLHSWNHYFPNHVVDVTKISPSRANSLGIKSKRQSAPDEDSLTMAIESSLPLTHGFESKIDAVYVGSESHPYAVKPQVTILQSILNLKRELIGADLQFACRAGLDAVLICASLIDANHADYALAVGTDVAGAGEGDILELTASAGASSWLLSGVNKKALYKLTEAFSYISDTPDFWRHTYDVSPSHAGRFTGEPAYFHHLKEVFDQYLKSSTKKLENVSRIAIHAPNSKFPRKLSKMLGISSDQLQEPLATHYGNPYSANVMIQAELISSQIKKGETLLILSYGSGAGAIALEMEKL